MKLALAGWAINRRFRREDNPLTMLEFPRVVREEFGLEAAELNNPWLESHDDDYLQALVQAGKEAGVKFLGMAVDGTGDPSVLDEAQRKEHVANAMEYFDVAEKLGLAYFRVNTGGGDDATEANLEQCIKSFSELAAEGEKRGIKVATENHGGLSRQPENMVKLVRGVNSPAMATLPDWGNFEESILLDGIRMIMPWACNCHVKWTRRDGTRRDLAPFVAMAKEMGFDGYLCIEDGGPTDDHQGVLDLKAALEALI